MEELFLPHSEESPRNRWRAVDYVRATAIGVLTVLYVLEFIPRWLALLSVLAWTVAARVTARKLAAELEAQWAVLHEAAMAGDVEAGLRAVAQMRMERRARTGWAVAYVINLLNLEVGAGDRHFDGSEFATLLGLGAGRARQPAPEEQLSALPVRVYQASAGAACGGCCQGCIARVATCTGHWRGDAGQREREPEPVCAICLESYTDGDKVLSLPCQHDFHAGCVKQWLRQQGAAAFCPMCKAPVFHSAEEAGTVASCGTVDIV